MKHLLMVFTLVLLVKLDLQAQTTLLNITNPNTAGGANAGYSGSYTFTQNGFYMITLKGSVGGSFFSGGGFFDPHSDPGKGATIQSIFYFTAGTTIQYTLGAEGITAITGPTSTGGLSGGGGGGGGASGVRLQNGSTVLMVAGGGGGAGPYGYNGGNARPTAGTGQGGGAQITFSNTSSGSGGGGVLSPGANVYFDGVTSGGTFNRRYTVAKGGGPGYAAAGGCCGESFNMNYDFGPFYTEGGGGFCGGGAGVTKSFAPGETDVKYGGSGGGGGYTGGFGGFNNTGSEGGTCFSSGSQPNQTDYGLVLNSGIGAINIQTASNPYPITTTPTCSNSGTASITFGRTNDRDYNHSPYTFKWYKNGQLVGTTNSFNASGFMISTTLSNLTGGDYYAEIYDKNNVLQNPWPPQYATVGGTDLSIVPTLQNSISVQGDSAQLNIQVSGGVPPYTGAGIRKLPAGLQPIIVTDAQGCSTTLNYFVCPASAVSGQTAICSGQSGTLNANFIANRALKFTKASSQYITVPHSASNNLGASFTLEAWVNYSGTNVAIVDKGDYDFLFLLNMTGYANNITGYENKLAFSNKNTNWVYSNGTVPENVWTHVAVTLSSGTLTFYINGVPSGNAPVTFAQDNQPMNIGRQAPATCQCNHFNGTMDELRIWNVARSATEILASMNVSVPVNSNGLAAYYKFDEGTGTTTADATGNGNNGSLVNGPAWQTLSSLQWLVGGQTTPTISVNMPGIYTTRVINAYGCITTLGKAIVTTVPATTLTKSGASILCQGQSVTLGGSLDSNRAISFNKNSSQYITVPHSSSINLAATFTMEAWVNYSGSDVTILDKGDYDFLWQLNKTGSGNKIGFQNKNTGPWVYSTGTVPINTWTHVAIVLNGGTLTFYINGIQSGTAPVIFSQDNQPLTIGRQQPTSCACNHFNGTMDELRIWNIARTPIEIMNNRYIPVDAASPGLVAYYKFDEKSGNTVTDASSYGNNGTMINGPTRQSPSTSPFIAPVSTVWTPGGATTSSITVNSQDDYKAVFINTLGCVDSSIQTVFV